MEGPQRELFDRAKGVRDRIERDPLYIADTDFQDFIHNLSAAIQRDVVPSLSVETRQWFTTTLSLLKQVASSAPKIKGTNYMARCPTCLHGLYWEQDPKATGPVYLACSNDPSNHHYLVST
jgi:hypothetical protein